jgi:hypothetical protein
MTYNVETYNSVRVAFSKAGEKARDTANAFAPQAYFGLIENIHSIDSITADLCTDGGYKSKKGKALASALPQAVKKALGEVKRGWTNYALESAIGVDVRLAVNGFIGLLNAEQEAEFAAGFATVCESKGWNEPSEAQTLRYRSAYLDSVYPGRPTSFAALNSAISKAISQSKADESAEGETDGETDGESQPVASVPAQMNVWDVVEMAKDAIDHADGEGLALADLEGLVASITAAWQRMNATQEAIAA